MPPPKIKRNNANTKATILRYIPPFLEEKIPIIKPIIASGMTNQFPQPRNGIKQMIARRRIPRPQIMEIRLSMNDKI